MADTFIRSFRRRLTQTGSVLTMVAAAMISVSAQSPTPTPANEPTMLNGYEVTSTVEFGLRGLSVNGSDNKYRSDYNYRPGFRLFDSSFFMENKEKSSKFVDSLLVTSSGWLADPSGYTRVSMEKAGLYKFDSKVRQIVYFNNLDNHARNGHNADTRHNIGDFDLVAYPLQDRLRIRVGMGFNSTTGDGTITTRAYSDEFSVNSNVNNRALDFRLGADGKLLGFNLSLNYGLRTFRDRTFHSILAPNPGYNTTNTSALAVFERTFPTNGKTHWTSFSAQRTFAKKLDFTARVLYSSTDRNVTFFEKIIGRDNSNNQIDLDQFDISAVSKRPQTRADFGITYLVTKNVRFSNTFSFDQYSISGGARFAEAVFSRTAAGAPRATTLTNRFFDRVTGYRRFSNTVEGDFQVTNYFSFNLGYRWGQRRIHLLGFDQNLPPATPTVTLIDEVEKNTTHAFIGGMKLKPAKYWTIYGDFQHGDSDNAFTRLANANFTNLRLRSRWVYKNVSVNLSGISKDNENPSTSTAPPGTYPAGDFNANSKIRMFSAFVDWTPSTRFSLSSGYTYNRQNTETDIVVSTTTLLRGISRYYVRDHYAFFNVSAQPLKRVMIYASYNHNEDLGQGNRTIALPSLYTSYPFKMRTADARLAFRFTRNIEWNVGYQYIGYNEVVHPLSVTGRGQDYNANLPYTSLRIYFGGGER